MRRKDVSRAAVAALGAAALHSGAAMAQDYDRGRNVSVLERERQDYDAIGINVGGFSLFPRLDARGVYSSNVFASETNEKSDVFFAFDPSLEARSNWGRHQLQAEAGLRLRRFVENESEDQDGWVARALGRLDIHGESYATGMLEAERIYEERGAEDFPGAAAEPLPIDLWGAAVRGVAQFNRARVSGGVHYRELDFRNVSAIGGGRLDTSGRDRDTTTVDLKGEWAVSPDTAAFAQVTFTDTNYWEEGPLFGPSRDSEETTYLVGANFDLTALVRGEVGVGFVNRKYASFGEVEGFAMRGTVEYFPTQLTTITGTLRRTVEDSVFSTVTGGYFSTGGSLRVDHEFRRNILLMAFADYEQQDFSGADRTDEVYTVSAGLTYLLNRSVGLNANVGHTERDSGGRDRFRSFSETRASIGVVLQR